MAQNLKIAIQGGPASFHDIAARQYFADAAVETLPCTSFRQLCDTLQQGHADYAVMAIENALAGSILTNYNLLEQFDLHVTGEMWLAIDQNLMALPGQKIQDLKDVLSHPVALVQCNQFFKQHPHLQPQTSHDTADSAREIKEQNLKGVGAIASRQAAQLYGLELLEENIADRKDNFTRFLILSREPQKQSMADKASLLLVLPLLNGSLGAIFNRLHTYEMHVSLVQSIPAPVVSASHHIAVDLLGASRAKLEETVAALRPLVQQLKVLGIYTSAIHPHHLSHTP